MWKLLKSEIEYFKWLYILSLAFVIIINLGLTIDRRWIESQNEFPGLRIIWLGIGIVVFFFQILFNRKSGRLRIQKLIPVSDIGTAAVRLLAFIGFWICLSAILITFYIFNFSDLPNKNWLINLMSISGIMFLINSIPILYSDFYNTYLKKTEKIIMGAFWSLLWIIYLSLNVIFFTYMDPISPSFFASAREKLTALYFTPEATIINVILGLSLFFISIVTFRNRKLYLE